jgi:Transposase DDE domain group 1
MTENGAAFMTTECNQSSFEFHSLNQRKVIAKFDGGNITSDAGVLLLREVEKRTGLIGGLAQCFTDYRDARWVEHSVEELLGQRLFGICLGYEDLNDHDQLRADPMLAVAVNKADPLGLNRRQEADKGKALAGKSTLNRLELSKSEGPDKYKKILMHEEKIDAWMVRAFIDAHASAPEEIVLDLDTTDDLIHGNQEGRFFHGYYGNYCYLPLYIFSGEHLLCARLRRSNMDGAEGAVEELSRIVRQLRQRWPEVKIIIRADSGFCRDDLMTWCEDERNRVDYVLGLAKNERLKKEIVEATKQAEAQFQHTQQPARVFQDFRYQTLTSWSRERRVIAKAEYLDKGANPRFIVTSLSAERMDARAVYEDFYCARGDMENRIKEQQLDMFADRTSAATMRANQLRLYLSSAAYILMHALRRLGLKDTDLDRAQCQTIRLKLLKIGAQIRVTVRNIWISLASGYPYADIFANVVRNLQTVPLAS